MLNLFVRFVFILLFFCSLGSAAEKWQESKKGHFIIYYKDAPQDFVHNVEDTAEQYYDEISDNFGFPRAESWNYDRRAKIYIYDDQEDYQKQATQFQWSHGVASIQH